MPFCIKNFVTFVNGLIIDYCFFCLCMLISYLCKGELRMFGLEEKTSDSKTSSKSTMTIPSSKEKSSNSSLVSSNISISDKEVKELDAEYSSWGDTVHYSADPKVFRGCEGSYMYDADEESIDTKQVKYTYEKEYEPRIDWKKTHDYYNTPDYSIRRDSRGGRTLSIYPAPGRRRGTGRHSRADRCKVYLYTSRWCRRIHRKRSS